jgi:hypothetical protein
VAIPLHSACSVALCDSFFLGGFVLCIAGCDPEEGVEFDVTLVVYDSVLDCDFA